MDESKVHLIYAQTDACYQLESYLLEVSSERLYPYVKISDSMLLQKQFELGHGTQKMTVDSGLRAE